MWFTRCCQAREPATAVVWTCLNMTIYTMLLSVILSLFSSFILYLDNKPDTLFFLKTLDCCINRWLDAYLNTVKMHSKPCQVSNFQNIPIFIPSRSLMQHIPVPEVLGGVGVSPAGWLCSGVQVRVPVALLALYPECLRLFQISGTGKTFFSITLN